MIRRLLELFEGPEAPGPWSPPAMPAALHALLPWRAWDESSELYVNAGSTGFVVELPPFAGIDAETLGALAGTLADAAPERCTVQVVHWASPRFGAAARAWAEPRSDARAMRSPGCKPGGATCWPPAAGAACIRADRPSPSPTTGCSSPPASRAAGGPPGPASETALGAFRRALEGTLASAGAQHAPAGAGRAAVAGGGAHKRRTSADTATAGPNARPGAGRRATRCTSSASRPAGRSRSIQPASPSTTPTDGRGGLADIAVRVLLSAIAFPEVWPGWRGNALIGDFHRDFLQPGCPVLTCLTVRTGDEAAGEKAFLKSARATQQAGTGIARYLPGLPEKAQRLAGGNRAAQGRREAGPGLLHRPPSMRPSTPSTRPSRRCARSITARAGG